MKKIGIIVASSIALLSLASCGKSDSTKISEKNTKESKIVKKPEINKDGVEKTLSSLKQGYASYYDIEFIEADKTFHLIPKKGINETDTLKKIADNPTGIQEQDSLKKMSSSLVELSNLITEHVGKGYSISFDNPYGKGKELSVLTDGNINYPILN